MIKINNFYILEEACATKETGPCFPQISKMAKNYNFRSENSIYKLGKYDEEIPDFEPDFDHFILKGNSKKTDILSNVFLTNTGFIISEKFKSCLKNFKLPKHKFYPVILKHGSDVINNYYYLHILNININEINFAESKFVTRGINNNIIEEYKFHNIEELQNERKKIKEIANLKNEYVSLWSLKISLTKNFPYDFFRIGGTIDSKFYISSALKEKFIIEKLTGIEILETDKLRFN